MTTLSYWPLDVILSEDYLFPLLLFSRIQLFATHAQQHARLFCAPLSSRVCSISCSLSQWCYLTVSSSVTLFSFCLRSFPASGSFPMSQLFTSGGQSIGISASVHPMNIQGWFPLGLTGLISLQSSSEASQMIFLLLNNPPAFANSFLQSDLFKIETGFLLKSLWMISKLKQDLG